MVDAFERCESPESIPHLEPLGGSNCGSLDSHSTSPLNLSSRTLHDESERRKLDHEVRERLRDVTIPLRLGFVLENKGNVARDHLALERTYLAYVRTSLACSGAGVALIQLLATSNATANGRIELAKFAKPLGATIVLFGLLILVFGLVRFYATQSALIRGYFPVARKSIYVIALMLGSLVVVVFGIVCMGTSD